MACDDAVARVQQRAIRRIVPAVERPVRMVVELLEALVEAIDRQEERFRVRHVNRDRHLQRGARLPHRIEPAIVDGDE